MLKRTNKKHTAYFNSFEITLTETCILDCSHSGACDDDVDYWYEKLNLNIDSEELRLELKNYGAWDALELSDHVQNIKRIIWIAAGNLREELL